MLVKKMYTKPTQNALYNHPLCLSKYSSTDIPLSLSAEHNMSDAMPSLSPTGQNSGSETHEVHSENNNNKNENNDVESEQTTETVQEPAEQENSAQQADTLSPSLSSAGQDRSKKVKRSFSSYLSNIGQRKIELAEQERKKKEEEDLKQKEESERIHKEAEEREAKEQEEKEKKEREEVEKAELEKQAKLKTEREEADRLERERLYQEQKDALEKIEREKHDNKNLPIQGSSGSSGSSALSDLPDHKSAEEATISRNISISIPAAIPEVEDDSSELDDLDKDINSDAETVHDGSPVNPRRGRLIKKSELDGSKNSKKKRIINFDDEDDDDNEDDEDADSEGDSNFTDNNKPPKVITNRQHLLSTSRSASPSSKRDQKPKKRAGRDSSGRLKLQRVCDKGKFEEAKALIEEGVDVNDQDYAGNSALHEASLNGYTDIVELLLENGAEVDLQSGPDDLDTPLIDAATNGHIDTVKLLLKYGADPRIENAHGQNALDSIDEELLEGEVLKALLKKAALTLQKKTRFSTFSSNHSEEDNSEHDDDHNRSRSKSRSHQNRATSTSKSRADMLFVDLTSKSGRDEVYQRASDGDSQYVGTYLGNNGKPDSEAMTLAAKYGHTDVVSLFLGFGAKVDVPNKFGMTALMRTVGRGHLEVVKLLIEHGADPLRKSEDGRNAFDYAKDALIFDEEEVNYLRDKIEQVSGQKLEVPDLPDINMDDVNDSNGKDDVVDEEIKIKKRKISTNDTLPELKKKKASQENKHDTVKKDTSKHEIPKTEDKLKKIPGERNISGSNISPTIQAQVHPTQRKVSQPVLESEEEKQLRIQKEKEQQRLREEYQSKIAEKQQRRQEKFLSQFESQELKKQEELKKLAELEEERRIKQEALIRQREKEEEERREMMNQEEERDRRLKIRSAYPFALRTATFNNNRTKDEVLQYLPLYVWNIDGVGYIIDIQIILVLGLENFQKKYSHLYEDKKLMTVEDKAKVFNIIYTILRDNSPDAKRSSFRDKQQTLHSEFKKFNDVQVHWIRLDEVLKIVEADYSYLKDVIQSRIIKCSYDEPVNLALLQLVKPSITVPTSKVIDSRKQVQQLEAEIAGQLTKELPHSLRYRPAVIKALVRNRKLW
jgi:ankyrin repeat protein